MKNYLPYIASLLLLLFFNSCRSSKNITTIDFHDGSYIGEVDGKGLKQGKGSYKWLDGSFYEGDFDKDLRHGSGHFKWANGESYKGDYFQDKRTGQGIYNWPDTSFYEGSFLNGKRHGEGVFISSDGRKYEGEWFDDLRHGLGTLIDQDGRVIRGVWQNGKLLTKPVLQPEPSIKPDISLDTAIISPINQLGEDKDRVESRSETKGLPLNTGSLLVTGQPTQQNNFLQSNLEDLEKTDEKDLSELAQEPNIPNTTTSAEENLTPPNSSDSSSTEEYIWIGTVDEVEIKFITKLIDGTDTIFDRSTNNTFSGKMRILEDSGMIGGELELLNGRMHGEEFYFENGKLVEKNLWENGKFLRNLPLN